jgi:hypothetical protein
MIRHKIITILPECSSTARLNIELFFVRRSTCGSRILLIIGVAWMSAFTIHSLT